MSWTVPALNDCDPGVRPSEYRVLVAMAEKAKETAGGIILPDALKSRQDWGSDHARLVSVSPHAFTFVSGWPEGTRPEVGDIVFVGQFPGEEVIGRDGRKYRLCSDREIAAVIEEKANG